MATLDRLPARRPSAVCEELESLAARARNGSGPLAPTLTLHLVGGHVVSGRFLAYRPESHDRGAVLLQANGSRGDLDAVYVALEGIAALTVHHTTETLAPLSFGKVAPRPAVVPGQLTLDRQAHALSKALESLLGAPFEIRVDWSLLPATEAARGAVTLALEGIGPVLTTLASDELSVSALRDEVHRLAIGPGDAADLVLTEGTLHVHLRLDGTEVFPPDARRLRSTLEGLL